MRSEAMAWLFSMGGMTPLLLEGGYKAYRNHILADLGRKRNFIILGGLTGSGKTQILKHMMSTGTQVTDLEGLASHKGSAFGALGQQPQPSSEHFANLLYSDLTGKNEEDPVWLEDESRNIGTVFMPDSFYDMMQSAPVIALMMSIETRMPRLLQEYASFPPEQIIASVMKISKRLGETGPGRPLRQSGKVISQRQSGSRLSTMTRRIIMAFQSLRTDRWSMLKLTLMMWLSMPPGCWRLQGAFIIHPFFRVEASTHLKTLSERLT